jgi:hypothetical protein
VAVRGDAVRDHAGGGHWAERKKAFAAMSRCSLKHGVDQVAGTVDGAVEITLGAPDFQVRFANVPRAPSGSALTATALPEFGCQDGR